MTGDSTAGDELRGNERWTQRDGRDEGGEEEIVWMAEEEYLDSSIRCSEVKLGKSESRAAEGRLSGGVGRFNEARSWMEEGLRTRAHRW